MAARENSNPSNTADTTATLRFAAEEYSQSIPLTLHQIRGKLRKTNSRVIERVVRQTLPRMFHPTGTVPHVALRAFLQALLPIDPLVNLEELPSVDVVIPFVEKDIAVLPYCVASVLKMVRNPISRVSLVTPADMTFKKPALTKIQSQEILDEILRETPNIEVVFDHEIIDNYSLSALKSSGAKGWDIQQILKFGAVLRSTSNATLIVDADTVLLSPKNWLSSDGTQLLQVANEFEDRYMGLIAKYFAVDKTLPLSFVTHHQLMQRDVVQEMFPHGIKSLLAWWETCLSTPGSYLSEYEAYGTYVFEKYPQRAVLGTWSNLLSPKFAAFLAHLQQSQVTPEEAIRDYCSISFHDHSQTT